MDPIMSNYITYYEQAGWHNLRLRLISNFSQNFILKVRMLQKTQHTCCVFRDIRDKNVVNNFFLAKQLF